MSARLARTITLRTRLLLLALVPLLTLVVVTGLDLVEQQHRRTESVRLSSLVEVSGKVSMLVHHLQAERGATNTFVSSKGAKLGDKLPGLREATDAALTDATTFLAQTDTLSEEARSAANTAIGGVDAAIAARASADSFAKPGPEYVAIYTGTIRGLLDSLGALVQTPSDAQLARELGSAAALSWSKENMGLERAQLSATFAKDAFGPGQQLKVAQLVAARDAHLANYVTLGGDPAAEEAEKLTSSADFATITEKEEVAWSKTSDFGEDSTAFFATATSFIDDMQATAQRDMQQVAARAEQNRTQATGAFLAQLAVLLLAVGLTAGIGWWAIRSVLSSLRSVETVVEALGRGDVTPRVEVTTNDEIGRMGAAINRALDTLEGALRRIRSASERLQSSAAHLAESSTSLRGKSAETAAQDADGASTSASDVARDVDSVSKAGDELREAIQEIARSASSAQDIVAGTVTHAEAAAATVVELGHSSERINEVLKTVAAISEQTNLLALNATIEAARAGEAGKGFAVVAAEVKDLAQGTTAATADIAQRIDQLQQDTRAAAARITEVGDAVEQMSTVQSAIAAAVEEQTATTNEITGYVDEAAGNSRTIAQRIGSVADSVKRTGGTARETQESADSLTELASELADVVAEFTVRS